MNYKKKANITLASVATAFVLSSVLLYFNHQNLWVKMVFYIVEAALIGGMADWFAVTAIFRKPLGFPFHTAIIPKNRKTIVNSIVTIVEREFLGEDLIRERLSKIEITPKIITWIDSRTGREYISGSILKLLQNLSEKDYEKISAFIEAQISENTKNLDFNKYIQSFAEESIHNGSYKKVMSFVLDDIIVVAEGPEIRNKIYTTIDNIKTEKTQGFFGALFSSTLEGSNLVNIAEISDSIHMHLIQTLYALRQQDSEDAAFLLKAIEEHLLLNGFFTLDSDVVNTMKEQIVGGVLNTDLLKSVVEGIITELKKPELLLYGKIQDQEQLGATAVEGAPDKTADYTAQMQLDTVETAEVEAATTTVMVATRKEQNLFGTMLDQLEKTWNKIKSDDAFIDYLESNLKETINILIQREHSVIGRIARDTLEAFSDDALNKFIEDRAGNDLQWIRINGSIVGGLVGLLVFLFQQFFYDPIAVPFIRGLFL